MAYIVQRQDRLSVLAYDGTDPAEAVRQHLVAVNPALGAGDVGLTAGAR
jgi:hypothetical protein